VGLFSNGELFHNMY
jgi:hypothetical protein